MQWANKSDVFSIRKFFLNHFFPRFVLLMGILLILLLNKDAQLIYNRREQFISDLFAVIRYFLNVIPEYLVLIFPYSFIISFVWVIVFLKKNNYLIFFGLRGIDKQHILKNVLLIYIPVSLVIFMVQQQFTKSMKKISEITLEDEIIRSTELFSSLNYIGDYFYRIDDQRFIYFSKIVTDPVDYNLPYLTDVIYWQKNINSDDFFIVKRAPIENKQLFIDDPIRKNKELTKFQKFTMVEPRHIRFSFDKTGKPFVQIKEFKGPIVFDNFVQEEVKKNETIHYSALNLSELYQIKKTLNLFKLNTGFIWFLILLPFLNLFIIPLSICFLTVKLIRF